MNINDFVKKIASQFDETEESVFAPDTRFRELDEWSSLIGLSIIAMVDEEYGVILKGNDIKNSNTIEDIYNIIVTRV